VRTAPQVQLLPAKFFNSFLGEVELLRKRSAENVLQYLPAWGYKRRSPQRYLV